MQNQGNGSKLNVNIDFSKVADKFRGGRSKGGIPLEINLVPDIKDEMIKTLKLRNLIFFLCIVVASASLGAAAIFASIAGGQQAAVDGKKSTVNNLSSKLSSYSDLGDFLTIRDQLGNISEISNRKRLLSRVFGTLSALLPNSGDSITISELNLDFEEADAPTMNFEAQANANNPPYIDYNVLDSFKKSMQYMRYDFGTYVDKEGAEIPAYCIIENGADGATFSDPTNGIYAYWLITGEGCNPSYSGESEYDDDSELSSETGTDDETESSDESGSSSKQDAAIAAMTKGYTTEQYDNQTVVRIWRTPQFTTWYKKAPKSGEPTMSLDGTIENVAHFNSECITYNGVEDEKTGEVTWTTTNDECLIVPDGIDGITISDSSNGRSSDDELVLRFSAIITLNPEVFNFNNKHLLSIGPTGRRNVTDSYVQIQSMFGERASDCAEDDTACFSNNMGGN